MRTLRKLLLLPLIAPLAFGQAESDVQTALIECSAISDANIRVACFDALARQQSAPSRETSTVAPAPAPAPDVTRPVQEVAVPVTRAAPPAAPRSQTDQSVPSVSQQTTVESNTEANETLFDKVTGVRQVEPTKLQITLESGQVWRQSIGKTFMIREGDSVRISATNWGSDYRMTVEGRPGFIQVSRVQ